MMSTTSTALVTGGTSGIGLATARKLAQMQCESIRLRYCSLSLPILRPCETEVYL